MTDTEASPAERAAHAPVDATQPEMTLAQVKETIAKKQREIIEKDRTERENARKEALALKEAIQAGRIQDEKSRAKQKTMVREGKGYTDRWDQLIREINEAIKKDLNAYVDFRSAIGELMKLFSMFVEAGTRSREALFAELFTVQAKYIIKNKIAGIKESVKQFLADDRVDFPALIYQARLTEENKLDLGPLTTFDDEIILDIPRLRVLVSLWLGTLHGYVPGETPGTYVHQSEVDDEGNPLLLTPEKFEELKRHPTAGLSRFLAEETSMDVRSAPEPAPTPEIEEPEAEPRPGPRM